jgi:PEP-CTERM motif
MRPLRSFLHTLAITAAVLSPVQAARADGWMQLPNGDWGFSQLVTTSGFFTCLNSQFYLPGGSCTASGNMLTLTSGASSMTVTFTGSIQTVLATNMRNTDLVMGTLTKTFTGGPFTIPPMASRFAELFNLRIVLDGSTGTRGSITSGYTSTAGTSLPYNCCENYATYTSLGLTPPPPGISYTLAVFDTFRGRDITFDASPHTVTARVGLVPEPSTVGLLASGLLVLSGVQRTVRRRRAASTR